MDIIFQVFSEIQNQQSISSKHVYTLLEVFEKKKNQFVTGIEQCYLKVIKNLLKAPRKVIERYEKLAEKIFQTAHVQYVVNEGNLKDKKVKKEEVYGLFQHFLVFFSLGFQSPQLQIKTFCTRIVFIMLKILSPQELVKYLDIEAAKGLLENTMTLLLDKSRFKLIGIKIISFLQHLGNKHELIKEIDYAKNEMLRLMCTDDDIQIRKHALINIDLNESTFPYLMMRIRDKESEIRSNVYRKLIKDKILIQNLRLCEIYKIVYDGLTARDATVKSACLNYLQKNFDLFQDNDDKAKESKIQMQDENSMDVANSVKKSMKKFATPKKDDAYRDVQKKLQNFLETFEIEKTLLYPHIYEIMERLSKEIIMNKFVEPEYYSLYLRELLQNHLTMKKKKKIEISSCELFLLRVICEMKQNPEDCKELHQDIVNSIEECFPNGVEFCKVIEYYHEEGNLLALYQCLLLSEMLINCDETGRLQLQQTLFKICISNKEIVIPFSDGSEDQFNDVYNKLSQQQFVLNYFGQAYYENPIISSANELLIIIVRIFKKLLNDDKSNFSTKILELISQVYEPLNNDEDQQGWIQEKQILEKNLYERKDKLDKLENELRIKKGQKKNQQEIFKLEKEREEEKKRLELQFQQQRDLQEKIFKVYLRGLIISQGLLMHCRVDKFDNALRNLLKDVIGPMHEMEDMLQVNAIKSLALCSLINEDYCRMYFTVFHQNLKEYIKQLQFNMQPDIYCTVRAVISLRAIVDFIILYNLNSIPENQQQSEDEDQQIDIKEDCELFIELIFKGSVFTRTLAVEGLCKILINDKCPQPSYTLAVLLQQWTDQKIIQEGGFKLIQIITAFFKKYISLKIQNIYQFEQGLEVYIYLFANLSQMKLNLNQEIFSYDRDDRAYVTKILHVSTSMMSFEYNVQNKTLFNLEDKLSPQELFFIFMCKKAISGQGSEDYQYYLQQIISQFDFIENSTKYKLVLIQRIFNPLVNIVTFSNNKEIKKFCQNLDNQLNSIQVLEQNEVDQQIKKENQDGEQQQDQQEQQLQQEDKNIKKLNIQVDEQQLQKDLEQMDIQLSDIKANANELKKNFKQKNILILEDNQAKKNKLLNQDNDNLEAENNSLGFDEIKQNDNNQIENEQDATNNNNEEEQVDDEENDNAKKKKKKPTKKVQTNKRKKQFNREKDSDDSDALSNDQAYDEEIGENNNLKNAKEDQPDISIKPKTKKIKKK